MSNKKVTIRWLVDIPQGQLRLSREPRSETDDLGLSNQTWRPSRCNWECSGDILLTVFFLLSFKIISDAGLALFAAPLSARGNLDRAWSRRIVWNHFPGVSCRQVKFYAIHLRNIIENRFWRRKKAEHIYAYRREQRKLYKHFSAFIQVKINIFSHTFLFIGAP